MDPFFGNQTEPQSFHKYAYVHGDPVNGVDPTGMFIDVFWGGLLGVELRKAAAARASQGMQSAWNIRRMVKLLNKALDVLNGIEDAYNTVQDVLDILSIEASDPAKLKNDIAAGVVPTGGFYSADLRYHGQHGPDRIVKHTTAQNVWLIAEAKGSANGKLSRKKTDKGYQMSHKWIQNWLDDAVRKSRTTDGAELRRALRDETPMAAMVSHFALKVRNYGKSQSLSAKFRVGVQPFIPNHPGKMVRWSGFGGKGF